MSNILDIDSAFKNCVTPVISKVTCMVTEECELQWKLNNFSIETLDIGEYFISPVFVSSKNRDWKWILGFISDGHMEFSINILCNKAIIQGTEVKCQLELRNSTDILFHARYRRLIFDNSHTAMVLESTSMPISKRALASFKSKLKESETMEIYMKVGYVTKILEDESPDGNTVKYAHKEKFVVDISYLLDNPGCSDIVINVENKEISAHMAILVARSPVFDGMFRHDMMEQRTKHIAIEDFGYDTVKRFLCFLYTCEVPRLTSEIAEELLKISHKYNVQDLFDECVNFLIAKVDTSNVLERLVVADSLSETRLKTACLEYICTHKSSFKDAEQLKELHAFPNLLAELFIKVAQFNN